MFIELGKNQKTLSLATAGMRLCVYEVYASDSNFNQLSFRYELENNIRFIYGYSYFQERAKNV